MPRWEYLVVEYVPNPPTCTFSGNQKELDAIAAHFRKLLTDQKLRFRMENHSNIYLTISDVDIAVTIFANYLGHREWELVSVITTPSCLDYTFKRPIW